MIDLDATRSRFLQDSGPVRLCGIAANLARVRTLSGHEVNRDTVEGILQETKWFIEWAGPEFSVVEVATAAELVEIQVELARWQIGWDRRWNDPQQRAEIGAQAKEWSDRLLDISGLVT